MASAEPEFNECWVVLIDILGFSDRLSNPKTCVDLAVAYTEVVDELRQLLNVQAARYTKIGSNAGWVDFRPETGTPIPSAAPDDSQAVDWKAHGAWVDQEWKNGVRVFSDSIIMFFNGRSLDSPVSAHHLAVAALGASRALWRKAIPNRGAIAYGLCHVDPERNVFLGPPVAAADRWEKAQKWLGVSLVPESVEAAEGNRGAGATSIYRSHFERNVPVPTAHGDVVTWALNPFGSEEENVMKGFLACHGDAAKRGDPYVLSSYVRTARILLDHFGVPAFPLLKRIAGRDVEPAS